MTDKTTEALQELISELPSAPKEGTLVNMNDVLNRLNNDAYYSERTEDESWESGRKHMIDGLMGMPETQRLKVLQDTPEYQKLLEFVLLVRGGRLSSWSKIQDFLDQLEPLLSELTLEAIEVVNLDNAYRKLKEKQEGKI